MDAMQWSAHITVRSDSKLAVQTEYGRYLIDGDVKMRLDIDGKTFKRYVFLFQKGMVVCKQRFASPHYLYTMSVALSKPCASANLVFSFALDPAVGVLLPPSSRRRCLVWGPCAPFCRHAGPRATTRSQARMSKVARWPSVWSRCCQTHGP